MNSNLEKCYSYVKYAESFITLPEEYSVAYSTVKKTIEEMDAKEDVKMVMRLRYLEGFKFSEIAKSMKITYQWVWKLHKKGVQILDKLWKKV